VIAPFIFYKEILVKLVTLKRCIDGLKALRTSQHRTLDASVIAELDAVIKQLELCRGNKDEIDIDVDVSDRVLAVLARSLELATNLSELIAHFFGSD